ncbi:MAG: lipopolysaccharide heptosyltransferase II [Acidobacteriota bacterium]|nr:lipopolysaccharide heptosyltransferase II [Acidobacteriota bacterium]
MTRILIRATNWIGDAVMSLPAIRAVHARYPEAEISVLARPWVAGLYSREPAIHRILPYTPKSGPHGLLAKWSAAQALRREHFDCAILFQNAFEAAAVARLAGIPRIVGYNRDGRGWLLSPAVPVPRPGELPLHERFYYLELLRRADVIDVFPPDEPIRLSNIEQSAEAGRLHFARLGITGPVIGVSPGAAYGNAKRWLPERFAEAARAIAAAQSATVAVFGSAAEQALCEQVANACGGTNLAGRTTLTEFIGLTAACRLFLTNDSGAMHIAAACGTPAVTVFGSTDHITTGPTGAQARIVRESVECSPCQLRECPIDHRCMTRIPAARVVTEALALLKA